MLEHKTSLEQLYSLVVYVLLLLFTTLKPTARETFSTSVPSKLYKLIFFHHVLISISAFTCRRKLHVNHLNLFSIQQLHNNVQNNWKTHSATVSETAESVLASWRLSISISISVHAPCHMPAIHNNQTFWSNFLY